MTKEKSKLIKMIPVESSHVKAIGYDPDNRILKVEYSKPAGTVWQYSPVTQEAWEDLQGADSVGKWLHQNVKGNETLESSQIS